MAPTMLFLDFDGVPHAGCGAYKGVMYLVCRTSSGLLRATRFDSSSARAGGFTRRCTRSSASMLSLGIARRAEGHTGQALNGR